ncbi:MAG: histidine kinase [Micrococcaceae bacterium]
MVKKKITDILSSKYFKVLFVIAFALLALSVVPNPTIFNQNIYYFIGGIALYFVITHNSLKFSAFAYFYIAVLPYTTALVIGVTGVPSVPNKVSINLFHIFLLIALIAAIASLYQKQKRELTAVKQQQAVQDAIYDERQRIARELHDVIAHSLTVIVTLTNGMSKTWDTKPETAKNLTNEIADVSRSALEDIRMVIGALRAEDDKANAQLQELYWENTSIDELLATFTKAGLQIDKELTYEVTHPTLKITIYRIIQEALTNAIRYANTEKPITVSLTQDDEQLKVEISSYLDESTTTESLGAKTGLTSLKERVELFNGTFKAGKEQELWSVIGLFPRESLTN